MNQGDENGKKNGARRTIVVIHGKGAVRGFGSEGGGDLDTVSAGAIGAAWARSEGMRFAGAVADDHGADAAPEYDYAFLNYNEGIGALLRHRETDVILPDFPINALPPALRLRWIRTPDEATAVAAISAALPRLESAIHAAQYGKAAGRSDEEKRWIAEAVKLARRGLDARDAGTASLAALMLEWTLGHIEKRTTAVMDGLHALREDAALQAHAQAIAGAVPGFLPSDLLEHLLEEVRPRGSKTSGGWTPETMTLAREIHLFESNEWLRAGSFRMQSHPGIFLMAVAARMERLAAFRLRFMGDDALALRQKVLAALVTARDGAIAIAASMGTKDESFPVAAMKSRFRKLIIDELPVASEVILRLSVESSGFPVAGSEISVRRLAGESRWREAPLLDEAIGQTDAAGIARFPLDGGMAGGVFVARALPAPQELIFPDADRPDEVTIGSGGGEEAAEEEDADLPDQGRALCAAVLDRQFDDFARRGNRITVLADHHPYAPEILELLERRRARDEIGEIILHVKEGTAGKSGAEILHERLVAGKKAATPGLAALIAMARHLDLHLSGGPRVELAIELSKLIGSGHGKIEIAEALAGLGEEKDLDEAMTRHGWDAVVAEYETEIATSLPRVMETACRLNLGAPETPLVIHACMAPRTGWGKPMPKTAAARDRLLGSSAHYLFVYLYEFGLAVMRASGIEGLKLNELAVSFGGGGHPGAASIQLVRDPVFWRLIRNRMRLSIYPVVLEEFGRRMATWLGLPWRGIEFVEVELDGRVRKILAAERTAKLRIDLPDGVKRTIACVFAHPAVKGEESYAGLAHWVALLREEKVDYAIFLPRSLNDVLLLNIGDAGERIDLDALARALGAPWDGGTPRVARCAMRLNLAFKWCRWLKKPEHVDEILKKTAALIAAQTGGKAAVVKQAAGEELSTESS